eukprot:5358514-Amphidinium_carterae.1
MGGSGEGAPRVLVDGKRSKRKSVQRRAQAGKIHPGERALHRESRNVTADKDGLDLSVRVSSFCVCLLYTSDAADDTPCVDL